MPLLVPGLTADTPISQGLPHATENPKLLFPGVGGSGNSPEVLSLPREPVVWLELSFRFAPPNRIPSPSRVSNPPQNTAQALLLLQQDFETGSQPLSLFQVDI